MASFEDLAACYPIITSIVDHLDKDDLPCFRVAALHLGSRCFFEVATHRFAREFFSKVTFFMSRKSLTMLQRICAHPRFKHYVAHIEFASTRLASEDVEVLDRSILEARRYASKLASQRALAGSPAFEMLANAMRNLDQKVALGVSDMAFSEDTPVLGSKSFCRELQRKPQDVPREGYRGEAFKLLVEAAVHVGMQVDTIHMDFDELYGLGQDYAWPRQRYFRDTTLPALCLGLKKVQLRVSAAMPQKWGYHLNVVQYILTLAPQVEVLDLLFHDLAINADYYNSLGLALGRHSPVSPYQPALSPNLQTLRLVGVVCMDSSIIRFLANLSKLRNMEISSCTLIFGFKWSNIISDFIKPLQELDSLIIGNLKRDPCSSPYPPRDPNVKDCLCLPVVHEFNKETMAAGLDKLIHELVAHGH